MGSGWEVALSIATTVSQVVMTLSVVPDLYRVHKSKSTGDMVVFPLVAMIVNNNCWCVGIRQQSSTVVSTHTRSLLTATGRCTAT